MGFPISPVDGQSQVVNGVTYTYDTDRNTWTRVQGYQSYGGAPAIVGDFANSAYLHANSSYITANAGSTYANGAFRAANSGGTYANNAFARANTAATSAPYANAAYLAANAAGSYSNSSFEVANNASSYANGAFEQANLAYLDVTAASDYANSAYGHANDAFNAVSSGAVYANAAFVVANSSGVYANAAFRTQNTSGVYANSALQSANAASSYANSSFGVANSASSYANGSFAASNSASSYANGSFAYANLISTYANSGFDVANSGSSYANGAFVSVNSASSYANSGFGVANSASSYANGAFTKANAAQIHAESVYTAANTHFVTGNGLVATFANVSSNLSVGTYVDFNTGVANPTRVEGRVFYDNTQKALSYYNESDMTFQIGQEEVVRVYNNTGSTISDGKVVYFTTAQSGGFPGIGLAKADAAATATVVGVTTTSIANNSFGYVTQRGKVNGLNTSAYNTGDKLYLSAATAGTWQTSPPSTPNTAYYVARVVTVDLTNGSIQVNPSPAYGSNFTTGSIFIANDGLITQDSALFFDISNHRLGINTQTPQANLHVAGDALFSGNVQINGNLVVSNAQSIVTTELTVGGNTVVLNSEVTGSPTTNAYVIVNRGNSTNSYIGWDETSDEWIIDEGTGTSGHILSSEKTITSWSNYSAAETYEKLSYPIGADLANSINETAKTASSTATAASAHAIAAYLSQNTTGVFANAAFAAQNTTGGYANSAYIHANASYVAQNVTGGYANSAFGVANSGSYYANAAFGQANTANTNAATADAKAVISGVYANGAFEASNSASSYANGSFAGANSASSYANGAFTRANTSILDAASASSYANGSFAGANSASSYANGAFTQANTGVLNAASAADYANAAFTRANDAFTAANTAGAGGSSVTASQFVVKGTLSSNQSLNNGSDTVIAFDTKSFDPQNWFDTTTHVVTPTIAGYYKVHFSAWFTQGTSSAGAQYNIQIHKSATGGGTTVIAQQPIFGINAQSVAATDTVYMNGSNDYFAFTAYSSIGGQSLQYVNGTYFTVELIGTSGSANVALYNANLALSYGNSAFTQSNTANIVATTAEARAVNASIYANGAFDKANTANTNAAQADQRAVTSGSYANSAYSTANSSGVYANASFLSQNTTGVYANSGFGVANSASSYANGAFVAANTADQRAVTSGTYANASFIVANSASTYANAAFANANSALSLVTGGIVQAPVTFVSRIDTSEIVATGNISAQKITSSGDIAAASKISADKIISNHSSGDIGGEITLYPPEAANTSLSGNVIIDVYQNKLRFYETGGTNRGAYIDLSTTGDAFSSNLYSGYATDTWSRNSVNAASSYANSGFGVANSSSSYANGAFVVANSSSSYANGAFEAANADYTTISTTSGVYGGSANIPVITLTANGRVSSITNTSISIPSGTEVYGNTGQITANVSTGTVALGLSTTGVTEATYGSSTLIPVISVDAYGRLVSVANVAAAGGGTDNWVRLQANAAFDKANTVTYGNGLGGTANSTLILVDTFTGDGTEVDYVLSDTPISKDYTTINIDGVIQLKSAYSLSGNTITFSEAPPNNSAIEVLSFKSSSGTFITRMYTGDGSTVDFTVTSSATANTVLVTENGVLQTPISDYTISDTTLTFTTAPVNGVKIQIRELAIPDTNPAMLIANASYTQANTATLSAASAYIQANASFEKANTAATTGKSIAMAIVFGF